MARYSQRLTNYIPSAKDVISSLGSKTNVKHFEQEGPLDRMNRSGLYLGRSTMGDVTSGPQRSTLVLGPSRSGKTTSLIIPNLLLVQGPCVVTSTKDDVVQAMATTRLDANVLLFDPSGTVRTPPGVTRVGYSPIRQARNWDGAVLATRSLLDVQSQARRGHGEDHWSERAGALIAPLLHASALRDESLTDLATRIDGRNASGALEILTAHHGEHHAAPTLLHGILATDERERSGIWSSASGLFAGMRTDAARRSSRDGELDIASFFRGPNQLHVVSPSRHQAVTTPLVVGLIDELIHATYDRAHEGIQLFLALDEVANIAPLPRLVSVISEGGGQGVITMACLQDLSQARARWGDVAQGFLSLFPTTIILPGIADRFTLELLQQLAGRKHRAQSSVQRSRRGRVQSSSNSWVEHDTATIAQLAHGRAGYALALNSAKALNWVQLTPSFSDPRFQRVMTAK